MFVRKKTLKKNNDILFKRNTELNKMNMELQRELKNKEREVNELKEQNRNIENELVMTSVILQDKKKEIKNLKTLLTKNKIKYRKEN